MVSSNRQRLAFTLVELLVVVGIITVLIAIALPVLGRAREHANRIKCAANLRSIGQALTMYTQQYRYYPGCAAMYPPPTGGLGYAVWPVRLRAFMGGDQDVFFCPSQDERCRWVKGAAPSAPADTATAVHAVFGYEIGEPLLRYERTPFSYGYNYFGATLEGTWNRGLGAVVNLRPKVGANGELPATRVRAPANMIAIADADGDGAFDFGLNPYAPGSMPGKHHGGGANVLFCDGHVQWYLTKELTYTAGTDHDTAAVSMRRMWNNDQMWSNVN